MHIWENAVVKLTLELNLALQTLISCYCEKYNQFGCQSLNSVLNTSFPQQAFLLLSRGYNADHCKPCVMNSCIGACHLIRMIVTEHSAFSLSKVLCSSRHNKYPLIETSTEWRTLHLELAAFFLTILQKLFIIIIIH